MPDWRSATFHRGRMALLFMLLGAAPGCSGGGEEPYTERIENGARVLSYRENLPPETNPLEVGDPVTYGSGQSEDTYLLAFASFVGRLEDGTVLVNDLMLGTVINSGSATHTNVPI